MNKTFIICSLFLFSFKTFSLEEVYTVIIKKQEEKRRSQWSLADWLLTKKKIALMDQWLALNTSADVFESSLFGGTNDLELVNESPVVEKSGVRFGASMFIYFAGLEYVKDKVSDVQDINKFSLRLRLLGNSSQTTGLEFLGGIRTLNDKTGLGDFDQSFYGVQARLYLLSFLGIRSRYEKYSDDHNSSGTSLTLGGERIEYAVFADISFIQLEAMMYRENFSYYTTDSNARTSFDKEGVVLFGKLFF